ncbi:NADH:flavin oxidoreductase/NADH oxidase family protein [Parendozoicomonas sp. Alg238-R29]|uniref:NADH:flavin oxidoreductase/NADH oxidase family protein n=1 Tax=Parendozoicomonas sp. Alg238-R29 TaxID=2993446 RepID=UPI00248E7C82|nr:NADH:flavin oxidoreductase/NADH oxidase family protein [Parendozoicomonas sp. Alg238-R29]
MTKTTLNTPLELKGGVTIRNRFFKSAMSEQLGDDNHNPRMGLATVYKRWADGGIGLNVSGNIMIDRSALGEPKNVVLDEKSDLEAFRRWTSAATTGGAHFWAQLNHPGKQIPALLSKEPVAPSAIALGHGLEKAFNKPRALTEKEILGIIRRFATAAKLAKESGFTGVQIHGAHGYLVSQFNSARHNQRTDQWGGTMENRMRFVLEVYKAIREQVGDDFPVGIKLNSADFMKGGFTEEESMQVVKALAEAGIDLIEISGGTYENPSMMGSQKGVKESTRRREAYFLAYAEQVRQLVDTPLVVTGGFRSSEGMQEALDSGATDMIGLARPLAFEPDMPNKAMNNADYTIELKEPSTGFKGIDQMFVLGLVWYEQQIHLMAEGKSPKANLSAWSTVWFSLMGMGKHAIKKRRA